mgnify:CR=1 FL=1
MSILLEALRKTEKNKQARDIPTIHEGGLPEPVSEPMKTVPLVLLLVATLLVTGWFTWEQYRPPVGSYQPPVTLAPEEVSVAAVPAENSKSEGVDVSLVKPANEAPDQTVGQPRTPVESYQQAISNLSKKKPVRNTRPEIKQPATKPGTIPAAPQSTGEASVPSTPTTAGTVLNNRKNDEQYELSPIGYWELPDAVRAEVPEIKFSVLVYASKPADRFVLINGQRFAEGDAVQSGLEIKEIRREGVVFSYRLYQFLIKR